MTSFVRFIIVILLAGIAVNLAIVLFANTRSQRKQTIEIADDKARFQRLIGRVDGRFHRADVAVAEQTIDAHEHVNETTLLVRLYVSGDDEENQPLPLVRVTIPGNTVYLDGLILEFDALLNDERQEFNDLHNVKLAYFGHLYGEGEGTDDRFSFVQPPEIPELTRIYPKRPVPTSYEITLWRRLWDLIQDPPRAARRGLKVTWSKPAVCTVRTGRIYIAYASTDGVTLEENRIPEPDLLRGILEEADKMKEAEQSP